MAALWDRLRLFSIGELLAHRGRTVMSTAVMAVSAALLVAVLSIAGSVTGSVHTLTSALGGRATLEVSGITDSGFDQGLLPRIRAVPGVLAAVPLLRAEIDVDGDRALLVGADTTITQLDSAVATPLRAQASRLFAVPDGVLVGAAVPRGRDGRVRVDSVSAPVAGVLDHSTSRALNGGHVVVATLSVAQRLVGRVGMLDSIEIVPEPDTSAAGLRAALTRVVDGRAVVADPALRTAQAGGAVAIVTYSTTMAAAAALIVSAFLIYNAMSMAVVQRRPTLSLLRAIGGRRGPMVRDLLAEAALLGLLGGAIGAGLGAVASSVAIGRLPATMVAAVQARIEYRMPWYAAPIAVAACVLAAVAAAATAARQIYRVHPIEALAPVGASKSDALGPFSRAAGLVVGAAPLVGAVLVARAGAGQLSLAAISLAIAGAVGLCFAAMRPLVRAATAIARAFGAAGALGATTLERAPRRVWATAMTVMIGVTATVAMGGASRNLIDSATAGFGDLTSRDAYISPASLAQFPTGPVLPADLKAKVQAVPGVATVGSAQMAYATLGRDRVMLQAYEPGVRPVLVGRLDPTVLHEMAAGRGVVVSRGVAQALGVRTGATLGLPTPTGVHRVRVLAVVPYFSALSGIVLMDLDVMRRWYDRPGETILGVGFAPGADHAAVLRAVRAAVPAHLHVDTGAGALRAVSQGMRQGTSLSGEILWIVVLVSTVALLNTLMLSVLERRRELGALRAMGAGRRLLTATVLAEAVGIGVTGAALGAATGVFVQYLATVAMGRAMTIDVAYRPSAMLPVYAAAALVLALSGSLPPAVRAGRIPIVEAVAVD
jgi:putative ABC transport system permease protein